MNSTIQQRSPFWELKEIEYFNFEDDFVKKNVRCIPMIVRIKMDAAGIKLKLSEWSSFSNKERIELAVMPFSKDEIENYHNYLTGLIRKYTGDTATVLAINQNPEWNELNKVPSVLQEKAKEFDWEMSISQWKSLTDLQRFALLKLCRPGHENKNFPKAMKEFNLIN
jgi:hypothetical protein